MLALPINPYHALKDAPPSQIKEAAKAYARTNLVGKTIKNKNNAMHISMGGVKHTIHGASEPLLRALSILPDIFQASEKVATVADKLNRPDIIQVHKYQANILDGANELIALITIRESANGDLNFYDLGFLSK